MSKKSTISTLIALLVIALAGLAAWFWLQRDAIVLVPPASNAASAPAMQAEVPASAVEPPAVPASQAQIQFPVEAVTAEAPAATSGEFDVGKAVWALIDNKLANEFLQTADFPRRFVATVDNLGRSHAPPSMWPVNPTAGRFLINEKSGKTVINDAANSARYKAFVQMIDSIDTTQAAALYVKIYPLLQKTYEELGYPKRYFNDRFVEVIDQLLATPEPVGAIEVHLTEVKGPLVSTRPWVRYEYADPGLEQLTAGQKILMRVGADNRHRLKQKLSELRKIITKSVHKDSKS